MFALLALAIAGVATAAITAGVSAYENHKNREAQEEANQKNIEMQQQVNEQNQYNIEHAHQIEMKDLEAAGLNPVLTATGGSGAPISQLQAPSVNPVKTDLSGVINGINSAMHNMAMLTMAQSMAKTNAALLERREAGKQARLDQVLAARTANTHYQNTASTKASSEVVKKGLEDLFPKYSRQYMHRKKKELDKLAEELNWDFLDDDYVYDPKEFGYH